MLVGLAEILADARRQHYAVPLFNVVTPDMLRGVLAAAEGEGSPVIVGASEGMLNSLPLDMLAALVLPAARAARVPVCAHFDHGNTLDAIGKALSLGFTGVMFDRSQVSFSENCRQLTALCERAHASGAGVEGELGHVGGKEGAVLNLEPDDSIYTEPSAAGLFARLTGVDALAVAIGTAHGKYKSTPRLDIRRLRDIAAQTDIPLVLHGGSGLDGAQVRSCIENGICKINIFTEINCEAVRYIHDNYTEACGYSTMSEGVRDAVAAIAAGKMRLFGSAGRCRI